MNAALPSLMDRSLTGRCEKADSCLVLGTKTLSSVCQARV